MHSSKSQFNKQFKNLQPWPHSLWSEKDRNNNKSEDLSKIQPWSPTDYTRLPCPPPNHLCYRQQHEAPDGEINIVLASVPDLKVNNGRVNKVKFDDICSMHNRVGTINMKWGLYRRTISRRNKVLDRWCVKNVEPTKFNEKRSKDVN